MRGLFLKIFLCFWLSHTLAVVLVFAVTTAMQAARQEAFRNEFTRSNAVTIPSSRLLAQYAQSAAAAYESKNANETDARARLDEYLTRLERQIGINLALVNSKGVEISGHEVSARGNRLSTHAAASGETEFALERGRLIAARRVKAASGQTYVLVAEVPRWGGRMGPGRSGDQRRRPGPRFDRREMQTAGLLLALLLTAGIVSYGLARYLVAPTVKLRQATNQLASGDLSARVGPQVGRRGDELAELGRDFDLMAERIESLMRSERRLLGDISHELRSPLARLQVALDLAHQTADAETSGYLDRIEREASRLNGLIGHLLTLTRAELAGAEARRETINLAQLVNEVAADADFEARGHNRSVVVLESTECTVLGNAELLRSAIENVVRNGVRYTNEGTAVEISLTCDSTPASSGATDRKELAQAVIRIRDYGPGVPAEALEHLFRAFYRVADARDRQSGGVGLGLSITARAVHLHGGKVVASNAPDGGLIVELRIPTGSDA